MMQLFTPHFPKKDTEAQERDGLLEVTQQEWLSWVGFIPHQSEPCSQDSPEEGLKVAVQDLRL